VKPLRKPVFIAGPARSGTSLLLSILSRAPGLWSPYRELHAPYEWDIGLHPNLEDGDSNRLEAEHATPARATQVRAALWGESYNTEIFGSTYPTDSLSFHFVRRLSLVWKTIRRPPIRVVDKNPKHCFRVGFLKSIFPDARFVFLYRGPEANISSLIEGWKSGQYATYDVPRSGENFQWHFDLPPGWKDWMDRPLPERCAHQWKGYSQALLSAEERLRDEEYIRCYYEDVVDRPLEVVESLFDFLEEELSATVRRHCESLPAVNTVSEPRPDKWRKREDVIRRVKPIFRDTAEVIGYTPKV